VDGAHAQANTTQADEEGVAEASASESSTKQTQPEYVT
jgi:hypothetical protein